MQSDKQCRTCRRAGEKLFLKGEKCFTPKCVFEKKPYPPGKLFSEKKHRSVMTEYGRQLREKQKVKNVYGVSEKQFSNYVKESSLREGVNPAERLYENLESRLDSVIFKSGLSHSRSLARQMVSHGHILVNGKKLDVPSYRVKVGDVIGIREGSKKKTLFNDIAMKLEKSQAPSWMKLDPKKTEVAIQGAPKMNKDEVGFNLTSVIEFYSR